MIGWRGLRMKGRSGPGTERRDRDEYEEASRRPARDAGGSDPRAPHAAARPGVAVRRSAVAVGPSKGSDGTTPAENNRHRPTDRERKTGSATPRRVCRGDQRQTRGCAREERAGDEEPRRSGSRVGP